MPTTNTYPADLKARVTREALAIREAGEARGQQYQALANANNVASKSTIVGWVRAVDEGRYVLPEVEQTAESTNGSGDSGNGSDQVTDPVRAEAPGSNGTSATAGPQDPMLAEMIENFDRLYGRIAVRTSKAMDADHAAAQAWAEVEEARNELAAAHQAAAQLLQPQ